MGSILVVDDETASLSLLTEVLGKEGYQVRPADSAQLALAAATRETPDLVLIDVHMPGMDGFELCRQLKAQEHTARVPLIFVSATTDTHAAEEGLALGAVDFVSKPFRREELLARVRTHVELARLRGQLEGEVASRTSALQAAVARLEREIADRASAEEALRESEQRFQNIADTAPVLIWVAGPDALCIFFNKSWLKFTGRSMLEEQGFGWTAGIHPDDLERCVSAYTSAFEARREFRMEYRLRRCDAQYRWVLHEGSPRILSGGSSGERFGGYVGSCVDITDVRTAQEAALGKERVDSLRVLAGGIAHDLTNLMSAILTTADLAEVEVDEGASPAEEIRTIKTVASQAVEMARELMIYAGKDTGIFEQVDLSQLVKGMIGILKTSIPKHCALDGDLADDLPPVWGNSTHIRQILLNLILNASEAIADTAGVIHIRTSQVVHEQLPVSRAATIPTYAEYVMLEVTDTGPGISDEHRSRIFDPFFTTKNSGHGLGLSVVQGVVHSHGGLINVKSSPGAGTTFEILFPCVKGQVRRTLDAN
jgi:PAS domain S-box-containing protein